MRLPISEKMLADFARSMFRKHGRGAVVIDEGGAVETVDGSKYGTAMAYLYEGSKLLAQVGGKWPGTTKVAVDTYDPRREAVVIALDRAGNLEAVLIPIVPSADIDA